VNKNLRADLDAKRLGNLLSSGLSGDGRSNVWLQAETTYGPVERFPSQNVVAQASWRARLGHEDAVPDPACDEALSAKLDDGLPCCDLAHAEPLRELTLARESVPWSIAALPDLRSQSIRHLFVECPSPLKAHSPSLPVDLPNSWWFTELPPSEVVRKGSEDVGRSIGLTSTILGGSAPPNSLTGEGR
jgi:hypothetical protein